MLIGDSRAPLSPAAILGFQITLVGFAIIFLLGMGVWAGRSLDSSAAVLTFYETLIFELTCWRAAALT